MYDLYWVSRYSASPEPFHHFCMEHNLKSFLAGSCLTLNISNKCIYTLNVSIFIYADRVSVLTATGERARGL